MAVRNGAGFSELFEQAVDTFTGAMNAGVKFQEDMTKWWSGAAAPSATTPADWQKRSQTFLHGAEDTSRKHIDEYLRLFDASYSTGLHLIRKAIDTSRSESISEAQEKAHKLLDESMEAVRDNAKALAEANMRVFETWAKLIQSGADTAASAAEATAAQARPEKTEHASRAGHRRKA